MGKYVCMLRGVNVAGHNKVGMADLRRVFSDLGYTEVSTYVQSGNLIFANRVEPVAAQIEAHIADNLGITVTAIVRTHDELERVVASNPFVGRAEVSKLNVTFLGNVPDASVAAGVAAAAGGVDEFSLQGREVYLHCPQGYGRSKLNNTFWERRLRVPATTRNWASVTNLADRSRG